MDEARDFIVGVCCKTDCDKYYSQWTTNRPK